MERKVHREGWTGEMSVKERCSCPAADAAALAALASKAEADQAAVIKGIAARGGNPDLAAAIAEEVARAGQAPVLRCVGGGCLRVLLPRMPRSVRQPLAGTSNGQRPTDCPALACH